MREEKRLSFSFTLLEFEYNSFVNERKESNPSRYNTEGRGFFDSINFSVFLFLLLYVIVDDHDS